MKSKVSNQALQLHITELRRKYDEVCKIYSSIRERVITFLAGSLGLLAFLYNSGDLFIPQEMYGQIIYFLGFLIYLIAIIALFIAVQPVNWLMPTDSEELEKLKIDSEEEYLKYIQKEYISAIDIDKRCTEKKHKLLGIALNSLLIGGMVLIILKSFNNKINDYETHGRHNNQRILKLK